MSKLISSGPTGKHLAVTPTDAALPAGQCRALYIGSAGNVAVADDDDHVETYMNVPAGCIIPIAARKVMLTGTTASSIIALY